MEYRRLGLEIEPPAGLKPVGGLRTDVKAQAAPATGSKVETQQLLQRANEIRQRSVASFEGRYFNIFIRGMRAVTSR